MSSDSDYSLTSESSGSDRSVSPVPDNDNPHKKRSREGPKIRERLRERTRKRPRISFETMKPPPEPFELETTDDEENDDEVSPEEEMTNRMILRKIQRLINERKITEQTVLDSNLSMEDKLWLIEHLSILNKMEKHTQEYYDLKYKLYEKIKDHQLLTKEDLALEKQLKSLGRDTSLRLQILRSGLPKESMAYVYRTYQKMIRLGPENDEYHKYRQWIEDVLAIPHQTRPIFGQDFQTDRWSDVMKRLQTTMNQKLYGMNHVKERIMEIVTAMLTNPSGAHRCIAVCGPPGVGKTLLGMCLAEALELPFYHATLGGAKDASMITGHEKVYVGAGPGIMVKALHQFKSKNGVLFIDECDKANEEVMKSLLHVIDYSQNHKFKDNYIEIPVDISKIFFLISMNKPGHLEKALKDRMPILTLDAFSEEDKVEIGRNHLVPKIMQSLKMEPDEVVISRPVLNYILKKSKIEEFGVRQYERNLRVIFERINLLKYQALSQTASINLSYQLPDFKLPLELDEKMVDILFLETKS